MLPQKADIKGNASFKLSCVVLSLYFLIYLPFLKIILRGIPFFTEYGTTCFFAATTLYLRLSGKLAQKDSESSPSHIKRDLLIGLLPAVILILSVPLMDRVIALSGLGETALFEGARQRASSTEIDGLKEFVSILLIPAIDQLFFSGLITRSLLGKFTSVAAIYTSATIFTLAHMQLDFGTLALGLITAWMFATTKYLLAPILFHIGSAVAGTLLLHAYPRMITLLGFLYY